MAQLVDHKRRVLQLAPGQRTHRTKSDRQQWKFISRDLLFRRQNGLHMCLHIVLQRGLQLSLQLFLQICLQRIWN